jgi:hypothetical protein
MAAFRGKRHAEARRTQRNKDGEAGWHSAKEGVETGLAFYMLDPRTDFGYASHGRDILVFFVSSGVPGRQPAGFWNFLRNTYNLAFALHSLGSLRRIEFFFFDRRLCSCCGTERVFCWLRVPSLSRRRGLEGSREKRIPASTGNDGLA